MAFAHFLAMTAAEYQEAASLPEHIAWMACHFSPRSGGLSDLPTELPEGSLLIINDRIPAEGLDHQKIAEQAGALIAQFRCCGLLLDLQRPGTDEVRELVNQLTAALPCPVCATAAYAAPGTPVFLPPIPAHLPPEEYLKPWSGREIWLETSLGMEEILLTPEGAQITPVGQPRAWTLTEPSLFCRYRIDLEDKAVRFSLGRSREDLAALLEVLPGMGVSTAVGLFQELGA